MKLTASHFQIPFSLIADRYSRKPLIVFGLLLFALGGAIAAMADSYLWCHYRSCDCRCEAQYLRW